MNADAEIMRYFLSTFDKAASYPLVNPLEAHWTKNGFAFAAAEHKAESDFMSFIELSKAFLSACL